MTPIWQSVSVVTARLLNETVIIVLDQRGKMRFFLVHRLAPCNVFVDLLQTAQHVNRALQASCVVISFIMPRFVEDKGEGVLRFIQKLVTDGKAHVPL